MRHSPRGPLSIYSSFGHLDPGAGMEPGVLSFLPFSAQASASVRPTNSKAETRRCTVETQPSKRGCSKGGKMPYIIGYDLNKHGDDHPQLCQASDQPKAVLDTLTPARHHVLCTLTVGAELDDG